MRARSPRRRPKAALTHPCGMFTITVARRTAASTMEPLPHVWCVKTALGGKRTNSPRWNRVSPELLARLRPKRL
jgi:hypothetical protein